MTIFIGVDWSDTHHDVCILQENGSRLAAFRIGHDPKGFATLVREIEKLSLPKRETPVAIETAHNLLVDVLLERQYPLYILAPTVVKGSRSRFSSSGARTDKRDAYLLADILRTDRARFTPWKPNGDLVRTLEQQLRFIDDLTDTITRFTNRLRAHLKRYYPQALNLFSGLNRQITLSFLSAYPSPKEARNLSFKQFRAFCQSQGYCRPQDIPKQYARLCEPAAKTEPVLVAAYQEQVPYITDLLLNLIVRKKQAIREANEMFVAHPDHAIFDSLPGAGELLAPKLLVMFGDHRDRYPSPSSIQALAGTCPVTISSGNSKRISFRKACNREYRKTTQQLARCSVSKSPWAAGYFADAMNRGLSPSHAYRCLANRWLAIAWILWQRRECYDDARHLQEVHRRRR